ncbi:hypothetical protein SNE40_003446 [Patella caerulea]|uniref:Uncharacterized protein n=2 Tax=Patella caerulea TaxID=87958 RepID=A0AAN8KB95_PATCE
MELLSFKRIHMTLICTIGITRVLIHNSEFQAHKTLDVVWKIDLSSLPDKGLKMIDIFTTKLSGSTIGYDIYGLFTLQKSNILVLFGTILTYFIVAVQFKPDGTGEKCLEMLKNITSC